MSTDPFSEFATLLVELDQQPDTAELLDRSEAFDARGMTSEALRNRVFLLERFYRCVADLRAAAEQRVRKGSRPEQHAAVIDFAASLGLVIENRTTKQMLLLVCFFSFLMDTDYDDELLSAMAEKRTADLPIELRRAAVAHVQSEFGIQSWGAARRQLSDAQSAIAESTGGTPIFASLPIPGGDLGEN